MFNILPWILGMTGYWIQLNTFYTFDFLRQQATISIFAAQNWFSVFGAAQRVLFLSHTHDILLHNKDFTWAGQPGVLTAAILVTYFCISYFNFFICIGLTGGQSANLNLYTYTYCAPITILCSLEKLFTVCPNWKCTLYKILLMKKVHRAHMGPDFRKMHNMHQICMVVHCERQFFFFKSHLNSGINYTYDVCCFKRWVTLPLYVIGEHY